MKEEISRQLLKMRNKSKILRWTNWESNLMTRRIWLAIRENYSINCKSWTSTRRVTSQRPLRSCRRESTRKRTWIFRSVNNSRPRPSLGLDMETWKTKLAVWWSIVEDRRDRRETVRKMEKASRGVMVHLSQCQRRRSARSTQCSTLRKIKTTETLLLIIGCLKKSVALICLEIINCSGNYYF